MSDARDAAFDATWVPRAGPQGATAIRRFLRWQRVWYPACFVLIPLAVIPKHPVYPLIALPVIAFVLSFGCMILLAHRLSVVFGERVHWWELNPGARVDKFDRWMAHRGFCPPSSHEPTAEEHAGESRPPPA
jgi:hypothetical protein